jgi:hypothetical protein
MKERPSRSGSVLHGLLQQPNQKTKPIKTKRARFDTLVARYYPAVYSFACRFTDDGRKALALTRGAFENTRKQLLTCCDENVLASILISNVIRAGCRLNQNSRRPSNLKQRTAILGRRFCCQ